MEGNYDAKAKAYVAKESVIVPPELRGRAEISVQVATMTGITAEKFEFVKLLMPGDEPAALATIVGVVRRGALTQPKVDVFLLKLKAGKVEKSDDPAPKATTNDDGIFMFREVPPGNYVVVSFRAGMTGTVPVNVPKEKEKVEGVDLQLKVK